MIELAKRLTDAEHSGYFENTFNLHRRRLRSVFTHLDRLRLWSPDERLFQRHDGPDLLIDYLKNVGTMLMNEHFAGAKASAERVRQALEKGEWAG